MSYKIIYSRNSEIFLLKSDYKNTKRIIKKLDDVSKDPGRHLKQLKGREEFKLRVGDFRLIARVSHAEKFIFIQDIGHRKNIYRKK